MKFMSRLVAGIFVRDKRKTTCYRMRMKLTAEQRKILSQAHSVQMRVTNAEGEIKLFESDAVALMDAATLCEDAKLSVGKAIGALTCHSRRAFLFRIDPQST
jgi:hypothetical protein